MSKTKKKKRSVFESRSKNKKPEVNTLKKTGKFTHEHKAMSTHTTKALGLSKCHGQADQWFKKY